MVDSAAPQSPERAKALLFCAGRLAAFGEQIGLELAAEALLCEATIERFIACGTRGFSPATRRTLRANLSALARSLEEHPHPRPVALPRERAKAPYSQAEIDGYLRLAACQSTEARRMRCRALICLGAGAGVIGGELRQLRGCDVVARSGGLVVEVCGNRARTVPVLPRFHEPLIAAGAFAGEGLILGGRHQDRRNLSDALSRALCADPGLPRLQAGRLRSTWLSEAASLIGLQAFMAAAAAVAPLRLPAPFGGLPVSAAISIEAIEEVDHRVDDVSVALGQYREASAGAKRFPWLLTAFP